MRIHVTQEDIDEGVRENANCCAIACAIKRQGLAQDEESILVEDGNGRINIDDHFYCADDPEAVDDFILSFDRGQDVEPFSFELLKQEPEYDLDYDDGLY